ncbi:MAG: hypothetical protein ACKVJG_12950 [Candidatus Latescibacterota bacterium]|jgi:hypothetical protein
MSDFTCDGDVRRAVVFLRDIEDPILVQNAPEHGRPYWQQSWSDFSA